jgi:hypothetical protein
MMTGTSTSQVALSIITECVVPGIIAHAEGIVGTVHPPVLCNPGASVGLGRKAGRGPDHCAELAECNAEYPVPLDENLIICLGHAFNMARRRQDT